MIRISVVIPARNRGHTLPKCIDSIIAQTYPASEIIVVDDNSSDDTRDVVNRYSQRGAVYLRLPKGKEGAQVARNHGIRSASHEWIAFQDSDDIWLPNKLAVQVSALATRDFDKATVVHGNGLKRDAKSGEEIPLIVPETSGNCYAQLLMRPAPMFPAMLTSAQALKQAGYLDEDCPSYQEWDTAIRLSRRCYFVHLSEPLFVWIWHQGETISKDNRRSILGYDYVLSKYRDETIVVHGSRAWRTLKVGSVIQAMRSALWAEAERFIELEGNHPAFIMARLFCRAKFAPRGVGRLLRLFA